MSDPEWLARARAEGRVTEGPRAAVPAGRTRKAPPTVEFTAAWVVTLTLPLRLVSAANAREHWAARARRVAAEQSAVGAGFAVAGLPTPPQFRAARVALTRLGGRRWDDDNNVSGLKAVRDRVAAWLGVDDGCAAVVWAYAQRPGGPPGVEVRIEGEGGF